MKIGILTLPLHTNYGGILQAYALQTVLERMGHEVYVIDLNINLTPLLSWKKKYLCYVKRLLLKYIVGNKSIRVFHEEYEKKALPIIRQYTNRFICQYINRYPINSFDEIGGNIFFNTYIVGSDQIWRPKYLNWDIENSFLRFDKRKDSIKIAYAASFGVDTWEFTPEQTSNCRELIKQFDFVSVREKSAVSLCRHHLGIDAEWVVDPTMLLKREDYCRLVANANIKKSEGNLMVYILDTNEAKEELVNKIASCRNLVPFNVNSDIENNRIPLEKRIQPSVESWLRGFIDAEYVVTDSFHCCVFSILFNKPFIVVGNEGRGITRIDSLLEMLELNGRIVTPKSNLSETANEPICWDTIGKILENERKKSLETLTNHLRK